jgi:alkanesulfonate monooxygenase SsuD/methylene tetrahydromethanopterin reductase-like flavin-dependent oxidoreductase (luciferase family)
MGFNGEFGLQFTIHIANRYSVPEIVRLADFARGEGFTQVWVNDNLRHRNVFVVLTAIASRVPIKLGTAIFVPYFRNPVDVAGALAAISELMEGREFSVGIARGDLAQAGHQIQMTRPIAMVRETTLFLQALLQGETVSPAGYPVVDSYYHFREASKFRMGFSPSSPIRFYCGGTGPKILQIAGAIMDGVLIGGFYIPLVRTGRLKSLMAIARHAASDTGGSNSPYNICEINVSLSRDGHLAKQFTKRYIAHMVLTLELMGFAPDEFRALGFKPEKLAALKDAYAGGATIEDAAEMLTDKEIEIGFVAGEPEECREQLKPLVKEATTLGFDQISFAKLGPDYDEAIRLLKQKVMPALA